MRALRKIAPVSVWIAACALLVAFLAGVVGIALLRWARSPNGREAIRTGLVAQVQRQLGGKVAIDRVDGDLTRGIALQNVRFFDARGRFAFRARAIRVRYDLLGLLRREVRIEALTLEEASLHARRSPAVPGAGGGPSRILPPGFVLQLRSFEMNARVFVAGLPTEDLRGELLLDGSARVERDRGAATITKMIFTAQSPLPVRSEATGVLRWDPRGPRIEDFQIHATAGQLEAMLRADGNQRDLAIDATLLPPRGVGRATAHVAQAPSGGWAWSAEIQARDLDPASFDRRLPPGRIALQARAHGEDARFTAAIDRLHAEIGGAGLFAHGTLAMDPSLAGDLRIVARSSDLSRLQRLGLPEIGGSFEARAHLYGHGLARTDAIFDGRELRARDVRVASIHAELRREGVEGELLVTANTITHPLIDFSTLRFTASHRASRIGVSLLACGSQNAIARMHAHGFPRRVGGKWELDAVLDDLLLSARGEALHLDGPGHLRLDRGAIRGHLALAARAQHLFLDGKFDRARHTIDLAVRGDRLQLGRLARRLLPIPVERGLGDLTATVHGPLLAPEAKLHLDARGWKIGELDTIDFSVDGNYAQRHATAHARAQLRGALIVDLRADTWLDPRALLAHRKWRDLPILVEAIVPPYDLSRIPKLSGEVAGRADLHGTLSHPLASAQLRARDLRVSENLLGSGQLDATFDGNAFTATVDATTPPHGTFHLAARAPLDPNAPLDATMNASAITLDLHDLSDLRRLDGTLNAHFQIGGTRSHPSLSGESTFRGGRLILASDPRHLHDLTVDVVAHDRTFDLRAMKGRIRDGTLAAHGTLTLDGLHPASIDLVADAHRIPFDAANPEAWVSLRSELHARTEAGTLRGSLTFSDARAELPSLGQGRALQPTGPLEDVVFHGASTSRRRALREAASAVEAELVAHLPGPFRVRSSELSADLRGELDVRAGRDGLRLSGHAETMTGHIEILRHRWEIEHARIRFEGGPEIDPRLDVRVTRRAGHATVVIEVHGTKSHPELVLGSEPPIYDTTQIIGFIVAGDPAQQQISSPTVENQIAGALSGMLVTRLLDQVAPGLPIDVLRVDTANIGEGSTRHTRLEIGRYLGERLYVSYVHRFGANGGGLERGNTVEANVEYRFSHRATLSLRYGDAQVGAIELSWLFRY